MLKALGIIMFIVPFFLLIKNTCQTTNREYLQRDLKVGIITLIIVSLYWGIAGYLLGK